jgi:hypothetical protein
MTAPPRYKALFWHCSLPLSNQFARVPLFARASAPATAPPGRRLLPPRYVPHGAGAF